MVATWGFFNGKGSERHEARQLGGPLLPFPPTLPGREERLKWQLKGGGEAVVFFSGLKGDFFLGKTDVFYESDPADKECTGADNCILSC